MFNRHDPRRARFLRGTILQLVYLAGNGDSLNPDDPFAMSRGVLTTALDQLRQLPSAVDMNNAVRYLDEKGYLEVVWERGDTGAFESIKLVATGIDIVEGTISDPGVSIPNLR
jgi:hypothetical protein